MAIYEVPLSLSGKMADISAEAFMDNNDPIGNFIFKDEPGSAALNKRFFRSLVTSCSPKAVREATSKDMEAISIWFPPGLGHEEDVDADPFLPQDFTLPETPKRMQAVNDVITALTAALGHEPQWYMHLVAVRPQFKGKGYAWRLASPILERASAAKLPCTLITQCMDNVKTYQRWGFKVVREMAVPGSQERFYSMRKD